MSPGPPVEWSSLALEVLHGGRLTCGPRVERFERAFAEFVGSRFAVCVNSGSSANLLLTAALGLQPMDKVLVPVLTWPTTVAPVIQLGLRPVWIDARADTFQMDAEDANEEMDRFTGAIWVAHLMGNAVDLDALELPKGAYLLEDCCDAFGTRYNWRHVGTFGLAGTFSFFMTHQLMTGEGGMIVTDDETLAEKLRSMRSHGWVRTAKNPFWFQELGFNFRPTELTGAWGEQQLEAWPDAYLTRRERAGEMGGVRGVESMELTAGVDPSWFAWVVRSKRREEGMDALTLAGVETRPLLGGSLLNQPAFAPFGRAGDYPVAAMLGRETFYWPLHQGMSEHDTAHIRSVVENA